jgi:small subunit ribosomal protein S17
MKMEKKKKARDRIIVKGKDVAMRGRKFEGYVTRKFEKRITIEFERINFVRKYERYSKSKTKIHAYLPEKMKEEINIGDYVQVIECRPLSKIMHHVVVKKIKSREEVK